MLLKSKILLPILGALLIGLGLASFIAFQAKRGFERVDMLMNKALDAKHYSAELTASFDQADAFTQRVLSMSSIIGQKEIETTFEQAVGPLAAAIQGLEENALSNEKRALCAELRTKYSEWLKDNRIVLGLEKSRTIPTQEKLQRARRQLSDLISRAAQLAARDANVETAQAVSAMSKSLLVQLIIAGGVALLAALCAYFIARNISQPLIALKRSAENLAAGDTSVEFSQVDRKDEIGGVARAIAGFRDGVLNQAELERKSQRDRATQQSRQQTIEKLIADFSMMAESALTSVEDKMVSMERIAQRLSERTVKASNQAQIASDASSITSDSVRTVAYSADGISDSISKTSHRVAQAANAVNKANATVRNTNEQIMSLADAASRIGDVISLIQDIAEQTNLLALNATIEAARAGESGKGFAVVASEVKALASQTGRATDEISSQITEIQSSTDDAVVAIKSIAETMDEVNCYTDAIAEAMGAQGAATSEISGNVQQASTGSDTVNDSIVVLTTTISETQKTATDVASAAREATNETTELKQSVERFLSAVREA